AAPVPARSADCGQSRKSRSYSKRARRLRNQTTCDATSAIVHAPAPEVWSLPAHRSNLAEIMDSAERHRIFENGGVHAAPAASRTPDTTIPSRSETDRGETDALPDPAIHRQTTCPTPTTRKRRDA